MEPTDDNAAASLEGLILNGRWKVIKRISPSTGSTGGHFSIRYEVLDTTTNNKAFLKALNFKAFFAMHRGKDPVDVIAEQNSAFKYERDVLQRCMIHNLSKITRLLDQGTATLENFPIPTVPFLILEMADGDIRSTIDFSNTLDFAWKLRSLHNVAVAIKQLHGIGVEHQDLKPSNILIYENGKISKVGDLGSSLCSAIAPLKNPSGRFQGDADYVPIEYLYGHIEPDEIKRGRATDMYLFGNLLSFYFTGFNMTNLIFRNIDRQFRWNNWTGGFSTVKEYLLNGYSKALREFRKEIPNDYLGDELCEMLRYTCFPYPNKRGHPVALNENGNQYDFHRIISRLDLLSKKIELDLLKHGN
jgi:serine/threonine protein kinase